MSDKDAKRSSESLQINEAGSVSNNFGAPEWSEEKARSFYASLDAESHEYFLEKTGHGLTLDEKDHLTPDLLYLLDKLSAMTDELVLEIFAKVIDGHDQDVNFPTEDWAFVNQVVDGEVDLYNDPKTNFKARVAATLFYYHSPYPEVRSITDVFNNPEEPCETIRSYVISIVWVIITAGVNEFFSHRQPSIRLYMPVVSVLMYPCGKAWEYVMPNVMVPWFGGQKLPLNPGPYSYKEQTFGVLLAGVSSTGVYVSSNIVTQKMFYDQTWLDFGFQITLALSSQFLGLSFAGIMRKFVIYPERSVWPTQLPTLALNRALLRPERKESVHGWKITRYNFFWLTFTCMFVYFWVPNYLFGALSTFNWITWIAPNNFNLAIVTGSNKGLGLNPITTFDWNVITNSIKPLATPLNTALNMYAGCLVGFFVIIGIYYQNIKHTAYLPINSNGIFTNTGESFVVTEILTDGLLDLDKYQAYSPPFYSAANLVVYGCYFAMYPLTFFFNTFKEWKTIWGAFKMMHSNMLELVHNFTFKKFFQDETNDYAKFDDPNSKMMSRYREVPDWYYVIILLVSFALAVVCVKAYPDSKTPVWGLVFVIGINFIFLIPFAVLYAVTGAQLGLNVLVELIIGYAIQGNGNALMTLKAFGYIIDGQAESFVSTMKIGHYAKIPPRAVFRAQIIGVFIQVFTVMGVMNWAMSNIEDFCDPTQAQKFTCPSERTFYSSSVFWGVIGPKIVFSGLYPEMQWCFLVGFLAAMFLIAVKYFFGKKSWYSTFALFEPTLFIYGIFHIYAPYNLSYITPAIYVSVAFMWYIRKRFVAWFEKYNYVLSAGLDAGLAFSAVIIFFAVQYHAKDVSWWGNNVSSQGVEGGIGRTSLKDISETVRGYFGPEKGHYPMP